MANAFGNYNETFFAQEALIELEKALGMAGRVHRGYDPEPRARGDTIKIRGPGTFVANNAPSTAQDLDPRSVTLSLDQWKEVKFKLTDKDLSLTAPEIVSEHIRPAAYALADVIDLAMGALYKDVPWFATIAAGSGDGPIALSDIAAIRRVMFDNAVPLKQPGMVSLQSGGRTEEDLLPILSLHTQSGPDGAQTLRQGTFGSVFGMDLFANQNTPAHTGGAMADAAGALVGAVAKGATSCTVDGVTASSTVKAGDSFVIAGNTQRYAITADATESTGIVLAFTPPAVVAYSDNDVVNIVIASAEEVNLAFHRNAFALATAPLSELGGELGARIATISDPVTNLSLRSRMYYVGDSSEVHVALDVLYGFITLDPNLAGRLHRT